MRADFSGCFIVGFFWGNICMGLVIVAAIIW